MLAKIFIENYALISHLEIDLGSGMQVITGETGAGKSIILGALRLLMGERADIKNVADPESKSIVEGTFQLAEDLRSVFMAHDVDFEPETIIRREILPSGKSRAFINDVPVTLDVLRQVSASLIDIHSQFETANLFTEEFQFRLLDGLSGTAKNIADYQTDYKRYRQLQKDVASLKVELSTRIKEKDFNQFLLEELQDAQLDTVDFDQLRAQLETQENMGNIAENLSQILDRFDAENIGLLDGMLDVKNKLSKTAALSHQFTELAERLDQNYVELKDILFELQNKAEELDQNPAALENLQRQFSTLQNLFSKHNTEDVAGLIAIRDALDAGQQSFDMLESDIHAKEQEIADLENVLRQKADKLHQRREKGAEVFATKMTELLLRLGLDKATIRIALTPAEKFNTYGQDEIQILFQANSGYPLKPIQQAVSGGERSRVMLAIKKILAENSQLPTLILDEIDTGVSGRIAAEMGTLMQEMGHDMQLIVITHLAQVAAKGKQQYKVIKQDTGGRTTTSITPLSEESRREEIAALLSGDKITPAALQQAEELMASAH